LRIAEPPPEEVRAMVPGWTERERRAADLRRLGWLAEARRAAAAVTGASRVEARSPARVSPLRRRAARLLGRLLGRPSGFGGIGSWVRGAERRRGTDDVAAPCAFAVGATARGDAAGRAATHGGRG
jgi:hypothetical protein